MNDELVERLSQHIEHDPSPYLTIEGIEIFDAEIFNKYEYDEFWPWMQSLADSPVKKAMMHQIEIYAAMASVSTVAVSMDEFADP